MSKTSVIRLSGLACIVFGALLSLMFLLRVALPDPDPTTGSHVIVGTLRVLTAAFGILAFTGVYARQVEPAGPIIVIFFLVDIVFLIGVILFGAATLRAGVLPRRAVTVMLVGAVTLSISDFLPGFVAPASALLTGLGFAWLGYALWSGTEEHTRQTAAPITT